ncbi:HD domain-containing protein [Thiocystis violascens]|uniref:Molecular chaperone of HSP90 family n=1 Tax=Thiocystis violascens (strain ATCC 17096 / DSM 198 / 6111) TaxID=765911 RepID=I3Y939_THIV6|nr:ATP-binding protein [Thiocystis violascens]AFL73507.1 molecular chaperone of HSP90 family [Thiocystis violascens DSM 198]
MFEFEGTSLWKDSLASRDADPNQKARESLRVTLLDIRNRVAALVSLISAEIPGLTVHDVTHLDALWETASLIAGEDFHLTPAEAFVLGGAILLHDAAHCRAAYPGGLAEIKQTPEWRDAVAMALRRRSDEPPSAQTLDNPPQDILDESLPDALRALHAKQAEQLAVIRWPGPEAEDAGEHLIQDSDLRSYYGPLIGRIAASHWWDLVDLEHRLPLCCNAGTDLPAVWTVDPLKIACLLRVADAAHIDHRRAPRWLRTLARPTGVSRDHWRFQQRLGKPSRNADALVYTGSPFGSNETDAWWLCFDTVRMIDRELRGVDRLLEETGRPRFVVNRVQAADSPERLARLLPTSGWQPVDTSLRVSDVAGLVAKLGGKQLYGNDPKVALRELIQNAADAIRARRCCLPGVPDDYGLIQVALRTDETGIWLDVRDNGIGMGPRVLTGTLLDFGASLWRSSDMRWEHPGLMGKGLKPAGRFGIGFFSVFMLGDHVEVTSRRYDASHADTRTLEFRQGLASRPVLRDTPSDRASREGGTQVAVRLKVDPSVEGGLLFQTTTSKGSRLSLARLAAALCPTLDVSVEVADDLGRVHRVVEAGDWWSMPADGLLKRLWLDGNEKHVLTGSYMCTLEGSDGRRYGRAAISTAPSFLAPGVVTTDGLRTSRLGHIAGVLLGGEIETVVRDSSIPKVPLEVLSCWATEQASLICQADEPDWFCSDTSYVPIILALGGDPGALPVVLKGSKGITVSALSKMLHVTKRV